MAEDSADVKFEENNHSLTINGFENSTAMSTSSSDYNRALENGSTSSLQQSTVLSSSKQIPSLEYLQQLLKDKNQLAAFPSVFTHVDRLVDEEISRVRVTLFQCEFTKEPLQLPEPVGELTIKQEKVFVPIRDHPEYNFIGRILGPRGMTAKQLEQETGCKIMVRGKGSMRDKKKEEQNRGKQNWEHLNDELHVLIQCEDTLNRIELKIARAVDEVKKLLVPAAECDDDLKRKQLMELALINGTYRNDSHTPSSVTASVTPAKNGSSIQPRLIASALNSSISPGLAGAPLIMPSAACRASMSSALTNQLVGSNALNQAFASYGMFQPNLSSSAGPVHSVLSASHAPLHPTVITVTPNSSVAPTALDYQQILLSQMQQPMLDANTHLQLLQHHQQQQQQIALAQILQAQNANSLFNDYNSGAFDSSGAAIGPITNNRRTLGQARDNIHPYKGHAQKD